MRAIALVLASLAAGASASMVSDVVVREVYLMGTRATLSTVARDRSAGLDLVERMLRTLEDTEAELSTWRVTSEISRVNARAGHGDTRLSPRLCAALAVVEAWVRETGGAFDPAVGALVDAWDLHGHGRIPSPSEILRAVERSGWRHVRFDPARCTLHLPTGTTLDVGGWGKGDGLDRARRRAGSDSWLIDLGGQVAAQGGAPGADAWTVSLAHPLDRRLPVLDLQLSSGSLATSAGSERDLEVNGRRIGHILDPRTGRPAAFTGSVTVWHQEALAADLLSTALFVMGPGRGMAYAEDRGIAALYLEPLADEELRSRASSAFTRRFGRVTAGPTDR